MSTRSHPLVKMHESEKKNSALSCEDLAVSNFLITHSVYYVCQLELFVSAFRVSDQ